MQNTSRVSDESITVLPLILLHSVRALNKEINPAPPAGRKPIALDKHLLTQDPLQGFAPSHFIHKLSLEAVDIRIQLKNRRKNKPGAGGCTVPCSVLTSAENECLQRGRPLRLTDSQW